LTSLLSGGNNKVRSPTYTFLQSNLFSNLS